MALKRYRYRAYPTGGQVRMLARTFGSCRVVFNDFVIERQRLYRAGLHKDVSFAETARLVTTLAKQTPERAWLGEVSAVPLQQAVDDASRAYRNFFDSHTGKRKGRRMGMPSRKRRSHRQSARFTANARFKVLDTNGSRWGKVRLPKIGDVRFARSRALPSDPSSVTVVLEPDGTYWVSFVVDEPTREAVPAVKVAALDLGLTDLAAVVSINPETGETTREKIANPKHFRAAQRRLARQQRALSRKEKAENQGRTVLRIGQWEPTTQTCSVCGTPGGKKPLSIREWTCGGCQARLDRDYNAAVNIMVAAGLAETLNDCGPDVRRTLACAVGEEAGTHRSDYGAVRSLARAP